MAPLDETTRAINGKLVAQLPGDFVEYRSLSAIPDKFQGVHFPTIFLNSLEVSGFLSHLLSLKVAAPLIILRSLNPPKITNGARCAITKLFANTIEARIFHSRYAGQDIIIPCIPLIPSNSALPFEFRQLGFLLLFAL